MTRRSEELPLPRHYKVLLEVFRTVDQILSIRHNRHEVMRLADLKKSVQSAMKRDFRGEKHLLQIRRAFPHAFTFNWEQATGRYGIKKADAYELHVAPNMGYASDMSAAAGIETPAGHFVRLDAKELVERRQVFRGILTTMARDHHRLFLASLDPPLDVKDADLVRWHRDFDVETCPEVECAELPGKPGGLGPTTASDVIRATQDLFGVNKRLEEAMNRLREGVPAKEGEVDIESAKQEPKPVVVKKGLEGLPPAVLEKLLAKERAKEIRAMTESSGNKKEAETLEELQRTGPLIMNCYRSEKQRQCRSALDVKGFVKFVAQSHPGRKGASEMEEALRALVRLAPGFLQFVVLRNVEYVKSVAGAPDLNVLRDRLKDLYERTKA